jgi:Methyltransferase domain
MIQTWYAAILASLEQRGAAGGPETYFLKPGYQSRQRPDYFVDETPSVVYQPDVYPVAVAAARALGASVLVDVGCGRGQKLLDCAGELETIGIDMGPNLDYCRTHAPARTWLDCDLDRPHRFPVSPTDLRRSVIICSDTIEHLVHPEHLLASLRMALNDAPLLVLSTPERDLTRGVDHTGPPQNTCHVREWNLAELALLLEHHDLPLRRIGLTRSDDQLGAMHTMLAVIAGDSRSPR